MFLRGNYPSVDYLWILEFQKRGAPHFHILTTHKNPTEEDRGYIATSWSVVTKCNYFKYSDLQTRKVHTDAEKVKAVHTHQKAWENIRSQDGARRYILKYALKPFQKVVPLDYVRVGRFWGCNHAVKPQRLVSGVDITDDELRELLKDNPVKGWDVIPKIIFPR